MKNHCEETFKATLKEVLLVIEQNKITEISRLINTPKFAIDMLEEDKK